MNLLIVNPIAGHGRAARMVGEAKRLLGHCEIQFSKAPGHATLLARDAVRSDQYEAVVAMGGDGTIAEVAAGIRDSQVPLGILPCGTGNDTCKGYGIPMDFEQAARIIRRGHVGNADIILANNRIYLNILSAGFDAEVVKNARRYKRLGGVSYAIGVYVTVTGYRKTDLILTADGSRMEGSYYLVAAGCGAYYGGGMKVLPLSDPCDGLLDICMVDPVSKMTVVRLLPRFMKGEHGVYDFVHFSRARRLVMEAAPGSSGFNLNADGEIYPNQTRIDIQVLPGRQRVIMPEKGGNTHV
jgi:diacylglycerol kinase (ATP)